MRSFLINELEPIAYMIYAAALLLQYMNYKLFRHKVLFLYYLSATFFLYAGLVLTSHNNWSYNVLFFINVCAFSWFYIALLKVKVKRFVILLCLIVNVIVFVYVNILKERFFSDFNSFAYGITFLTVIFYSLLYFHQLLSEVKRESLFLNFDFGLTCGYLLYFLGSFVIVIYYQNAEAHQRGNIWAMHNIILFFCATSILIIHFIIRSNSKVFNVIQ